MHIFQQVQAFFFFAVCAKSCSHLQIINICAYEKSVSAYYQAGLSLIINASVRPRPPDVRQVVILSSML